MGQIFSSAPNAFYKQLDQATVTCLELLPKAQQDGGPDAVFCVQADTKLSDVMTRALACGDISSVLVMDHHQQPIGFFDWADAVSYCCFVLDVDELRSPMLDAGQEAAAAAAARHQRIRDRLVETNVRSVVDFSNRDPVRKLPMRSSALDAARLFKDGIHRVLLMGDDGTPRGVLAQSDLCKYLYHHLFLPSVKLVSEKSISEVGVVKKRHVFSAQASTTLRQVIEIMNCNHVSGIAIVDAAGAVQGNFSATDLGPMFLNMARAAKSHGAPLSAPATGSAADKKLDEFMFDMPVGEYLALVSPQSLEPITLHSKSTVDEAITTLMTSHVHRAYLVDETAKPIGLVDLTDLVSVVFK